VGFGIDRRASSRKAKGGLRSLFGKAPSADDIGGRLTRLARRVWRDSVIDASSRRVTLGLHPAARPVRVSVLPDGDLEVRGDTSALGPGYHAYAVAEVARIFDELEYAWTEDEPDPREAMLAWLADELRGGATKIGMPKDRSFRVDGAAVLTGLGPRDAAWRDAVIADPAKGADAFPWFHDGPAHALRSRALTAMWLEVPWREPFDDDERKVMGQVDVDLAAALRADPAIELPFADWLHLLELLDIDDDARLDKLRKRAGDTKPVIGYRRHPMEIELSGGWTIELSGAFAGHWEDDGERWWATDGERVVEFTSVTAHEEMDSEKLLAVAGEVHPVIERLSVDKHRGRAEVYDEGTVRVIHGLVACSPHVAILTCKGAVADEPWALATWRSLRNT
jgi:hypothetical protein